MINISISVFSTHFGRYCLINVIVLLCVLNIIFHDDSI